jgi:hypothetical protein
MFTLNLPKSLFWDLDINSLDDQKNRRLIIERVFSMGDLPDIKEIVCYYGFEIIKKEVIHAGNFDNKTLAWLSIFLNIPKTKFKCYIKRQSNQVLWNY